MRHLVFFFSISFSRRLSAQFTSAQWDTLSQSFCKILVQLSPSFQKENVFLANLIEVWRNVECNPNLCHNHFSNCSALYRGFEWPCIFRQYLLFNETLFSISNDNIVITKIFSKFSPCFTKSVFRLAQSNQVITIASFKGQSLVISVVLLSNDFFICKKTLLRLVFFSWFYSKTVLHIHWKNHT